MMIQRKSQLSALGGLFLVVAGFVARYVISDNDVSEVVSFTLWAAAAFTIGLGLVNWFGKNEKQKNVARSVGGKCTIFIIPIALIVGWIMVRGDNPNSVGTGFMILVLGLILLPSAISNYFND